MTSPNTDHSKGVGLDGDIWEFLDEIDAPQWADLHEEAVLAAAGLEGDDPWFQTSHANHEKSLDELAEETGTIILPLLIDLEAGNQPPLRSPVGEPVASTQSVPGEVAADRAVLGSLHRVDLHRFGGGAKRLNIRALRVAQDEAAFSSAPPIDFSQEGAASQSRGVAVDSAQCSSGEAWGTEVIGGPAKSIPPEASSSEQPSNNDAAIKEMEAGLPRGRRSTSSSGAEVSVGRRRERSGGRGMQLPVAAESRQDGREQASGEGHVAGSGGKIGIGEFGSGKGRRVHRRSMGNALRVPAEERDNPTERHMDTDKPSPPLPQARSRRSAESGSGSSGNIRLSFGRRVEQHEADANAKKHAPPALMAHKPLESRRRTAAVQPIANMATEPEEAPRVSNKQRKPTQRETGSGPSRSSRVGAGESRPASGPEAKVGRSVAARTDSGRARTNDSSKEVAQRGPLVTLATGNTGSITGRAAGKPQAGQQAKRVLGPRLTHAAADFTAAPGRGIGKWDEEPKHIKASNDASLLKAEDLDNRVPQSRRRSGEESGDQDLAAMLAQHNRIFKSKPSYEPRMHSVRDTKQWESLTGKTYYQLAPEDREAANEAIARMKQART